MVQVGNVPEIKEVKKHLNDLQNRGLVEKWELPYENILTRLTAAIFFLTPKDKTKLDEIWSQLNKYPMFIYRENVEKKLSQLDWRVEFNKGFKL